MENTPDQIIAYYDDFYAKEGFTYYPPDFSRSILKALFTKAGIAPGARVLDVGCAMGFYSGLLASLGYQVTGIDISSTGIRKARELYPDIRFEVMDATNMTFPPSSFDAIFAFGVSVANTQDLHEIHDFLRYLTGFLSPSGTLLFLGGSNLRGGVVGDSSWINHPWSVIRQFPPPDLPLVRGPWLTHFRLVKCLGPALSMNPLLTQLLRVYPGALHRKMVMLVRKPSS